jgi:hypothetical protein
MVWDDLYLEDSYAGGASGAHVIHAAVHQNFMEISSQAYDGGAPLPLLFGQGYGTASSTTIAAGISNNVFYAYQGIGGSTNGSSALTGRVGEYLSNSVPASSAIKLTTGTSVNVVSITLTSGDWDVEGVASFDIVAGTVTSTAAGISVASGIEPADGSAVASGLQLKGQSTFNSITIPRKQINVSSPTTVYLVGTCYFSSGSVSAFGQIVARRMR